MISCGYAWLSPDGTLHELESQTHGDFARDYFRSLPAPGRGPHAVSSHAKRDIISAVDDLISLGWIRIVNRYTMEMKSINKATKKQILEIERIIVAAVNDKTLDLNKEDQFVIEDRSRVVMLSTFDALSLFIGRNNADIALYGHQSSQS